MTTGEEDHTQRVKIIQNIAADARILILGQDYGISLSDEGTESSAAEYTTRDNISVADDTGTKETGSNSLKITQTAHLALAWAWRALSTGFYWRDFVSLTVRVYRPAGVYDASTDYIRLLFLTSDAYNSATMYAKIQVGLIPAGSWLTFTITKGNFSAGFGGIADTDWVAYHGWYLHSNFGDYNDYCFYDTLNINAGSGAVQTVAVDSVGNIQVDVIALPSLVLAAGTANIGDVDVLTLPASKIAGMTTLPSGTNTIGKVAVTDVEKTVTFKKYDVTASGTTDLVTPGAQQKVQIKYFKVTSKTDDVVVTIWEEDNNTNAFDYGNYLDGNICNANLIGCNYITSTIAKKVQANLSGVATVYIVLGYVLL